MPASRIKRWIIPPELLRQIPPEVAAEDQRVKKELREENLAQGRRSFKIGLHVSKQNHPGDWNH